MSKKVLIIGNGLLPLFVFEELSIQYDVVRKTDYDTGELETTDFVVVLDDDIRSPGYGKMAAELHRSGKPWLSGFLSFGEGVVGPLVRAGKSGCVQCADSRRLMAGRDRKEMLELQVRRLMYGTAANENGVSCSGLLQMARLIAEEVRKVFGGMQPCTEGRIYLIDLKTFNCSLHVFLPDPECPVCGGVRGDSEEAAKVILQPSLKIAADSYRCRSTDDLKESLNADYLDYRTGLFNGKMVDLVSPFACVSVNFPFMLGDEVTSGRSCSFAESEFTAILEGLERYSGLTPRGKRIVVYDSFRHLEAQALHPAKVGLYSKEQYAMPDFPFKPFDPDHPIDWVWGYSFLQERPILIPASLAYYSMGFDDGFVNEGSNGCAIGGSLEEAILHGILEVVERDSFLMTWYAQLPLSRLDLFSANDVELRLMAERVQAVAGFDIHLYNSTMENGIPSIWALAKNKKAKGVNLICAAGSHLDPVRAAKSAVHELAGLMLTFDENYESSLDECMEMFLDSAKVQRMEDHSLLYSLPQAEARLKFLLDESRPLKTFDEEFNKRGNQPDLTEDLKEVLNRFRSLGLEVIVIDQSAPEVSRNGLHCVKVLIPGMLPMTFGHHLIRVTGLERVCRVPFELGYAKQPLTLEKLNPYPHPFP